jgi:sec-independent protein translocase protein TatA
VPMSLLTPTHLAILLLVLLLLFGAKRLPETGRALGRGVREFRDGITGRDRQSDDPALEPWSVMASPQQRAAPASAESQRNASHR